MILFDHAASHNFLDPETCSKLVDAGIDMTDASYFLVMKDGNWYVVSMSDIELANSSFDSDPVPTYTLADLLYKLDEWPPNTGALSFLKDAQFYMFYYDLGQDKSETFSGISEKPIIAAATLVLNCAKNGIHLNNNIKGKYKK